MLIPRTKLDETSLTPKESFYSKLTDEDYQHAQTVLEEFNVESMKVYHYLYNLSDVLVDIFETFRTICMNHYGLDQVWHFSAPGFAWDATLKTTKFDLELLSGRDIMLMIDSGIIGGIATISHRHAKANNEYMWTKFDPAKESKFTSSLDGNKLYGWAMSERLPTSVFKWMTDD